jgi:cystathionine beta-lyase
MSEPPAGPGPADRDDGGLGWNTRLAHAGRHTRTGEVEPTGGVPGPGFGAVNPPVHRASTVLFPTLEAFDRRQELKYTGAPYGIHGTPVTFTLAQAIADLSGGARTLVVSSGLAAVAQALLGLVRAGDHLLVADTVYGPTRAFVSGALATRLGVEVEFYDPLVGRDVTRLLRPATRAVYLESPGTHTFEVQDVPAIAAAARQAGVLSILDNTWATPLHFRAFDHGVDVEVLAVTKHLAGHSDLLLGAVTARDEALFREIKDTASLFGDCVSPDVCYEALRGMRTLGIRLRQQAATALRVASWLAARPEVVRVLYPPLPSDPGHALWRRDFRGGSTTLGVLLETRSPLAVAAFVEGCRLFRIGASFGGFESLIIPCHPAENRTVSPWTETRRLLRLHVGLEDADDLIADLEAGLGRLQAAGQDDPGSGP